VEISASDFDNNNNQLQMILNPAILTPANATVSLYPNPIQGIGMLTVVTRVTPATSVKMIIRDVFGTTVFQELRDISSTRHTFQWNLRNQKDKMVANGTYFIEIINPITGEKLCRGKAALLR
jgi:flagellar hook assembly protein FlgD